MASPNALRKLGVEVALYWQCLGTDLGEERPFARLHRSFVNSKARAHTTVAGHRENVFWVLGSLGNLGKAISPCEFLYTGVDALKRQVPR
jgi:hypothetical protein